MIGRARKGSPFRYNHANGNLWRLNSKLLELVDSQNDPELTVGLKGELHRLPSSLPVTHWLMSLATPTFKPSVSWERSNRILLKEARRLLHKPSRTHNTVVHTLSAETGGPLWFQASPASNRFLLEATGSETPVSSDATWLPDLLSFVDTWKKKWGLNLDVVQQQMITLKRTK